VETDKLSWSVDNVQAVYLKDQPVTSPGSQQVGAGTYVLKVVTACGETTKSIIIEALTAPTITFTVDNANPKTGETTTLRWDVANAQAVYLDGQGVTGQGTKVIPATNQTYTLRVVWVCGEEQRQIPIIAVPKLEITYLELGDVHYIVWGSVVADRIFHER
jgi:hypothetical protein